MAVSTDSLPELRSAILATVAYFVLYYIWIIRFLIVKFSIASEVKAEWRKKNPKERLSTVEYFKALKKHPRLYMADRTQLNMLEQMGPFLVGFVFFALGHGTILLPLFLCLPSSFLALTFQPFHAPSLVLSPFLCPHFFSRFWLYCLVIDAAYGARIGVLYVILRALYPLLYGHWSLIALCTGPCYTIIAFFFLNVLSQVY
jgi:hypothetical protein